MRDERLVQKLCRILENILGVTLLPDDSEDQLLLMFGRHPRFRAFGTLDRARGSRVVYELK